MKTKSEQYMKRLVPSERHLEAWEALFKKYWITPAHMEKYEALDSVETDPDFDSLLLEQAKQLDTMEDAIKANEQTSVGHAVPNKYVNAGLSVLEEMYPDANAIITSGMTCYPPNSYMGWHTNSDYPGKRCYVSWSDQAHKNYFRYKIGDTIFTDYDEEGVNIREFYITEEPLFWHCVGCKEYRFSVGYTIL